MMMKLNFSNSALSLVVGFFYLVLNGCSDYFGGQPPAPIYGDKHSQPTNPYQKQKQSGVITTPLSGIEDDFQAQEKYKSFQQPSPIQEQTTEKPLSPAVLALVNEADRNGQAGDLESAVATLERALRISPRNPRLTYKLAKLRLKQSKPRLAEDLARKAALLSGNNRRLKKQSWLLISEARKQQKNFYGAKEARLKADKI